MNKIKLFATIAICLSTSSIAGDNVCHLDNSSSWDIISSGSNVSNVRVPRLPRLPRPPRVINRGGVSKFRISKNFQTKDKNNGKENNTSVCVAASF